jgi:hypothetical protein
MRPGEPEYTMYGTNEEIMASCLNEIRQFTHCTAVNTDDLIDEIKGLREDIQELIGALNKSGTK